jgi:HTH-type transcriptional regulator/antitoxin HipB
MDYPINFADQLAQHLKSFRKARGLTQVQLALHLGMTQSRVAEIEMNPGKVSLENLLNVLAALEVRMLLREAPEPSVTSLSTHTNKGMTLAERKAKKNRPTLNEGDW